MEIAAFESVFFRVDSFVQQQFPFEFGVPLPRHGATRCDAFLLEVPGTEQSDLELYAESRPTDYFCSVSVCYVHDIRSSRD